MSVREYTESLEHKLLSPQASFSDCSRGRATAVEPCSLRTDFQRDRDRILHCKAFRRLEHKTQVFISPKGDHYRTRLTHTLEVAQIARTIARALRLNEDLTEAIALGHDLGHTPFGHMGERTLDSLCGKSIGGFRHNEQSLRVVDKLENGGRGLNLTWEVRDGIVHHSGKQRPATLEGRIVALSDRIAYVNHDLDDSLRAGMVTQDSLPQRCLDVLGQTHGERLDTLVSDVVAASASLEDIVMSDGRYDAMMGLRQYLTDKVYRGEWAVGQERRAQHLLRDLYTYYMERPVELPNVDTLYTEGFDRAICDHIAGMTDQYAVEIYNEKFIPARFEM